MYRKVMVGYGRDRHGDDALALARVLASADSVEEVIIVEVGARGALDPPPDWPAHVRVLTRSVSGESPVHALTSAADREGVDVMVLGSTHHRFAGRLLMGTTAGSILPEARWPVVIAPKGYARGSSPLREIGVAFDGSGESQSALHWAAAVASAFSAQMQLVAVVQPPPPVETWGAGVPAEAWNSGYSAQQSFEAVEAMREGMQRKLAAARESVGQDRTETLVLDGDARHELREAAEDFDMLVVGSHGQGRVSGAFMRSVARGLAHSCPVPLAVVPPEAPAASSGSPSATAHPS